MKAFSVNIIGLSTKAHEFDFTIDREFFKAYGSEIISEGNLEAKVVLDKHETFIDADFTIKGSVQLTCDRSLELFDHLVNIHKKVMFKYGEEATELTDEIVIIQRDEASLELGQLMYEFIVVQLPMKKLHPKFRDEDDSEEGKIVYTSSSKDEDENEKTDPRWDALKKLK